MKLDADLLKAIDDVVEPIVERDPAKTASPSHPPLTLLSRAGFRAGFLVPIMTCGS